MLKEDSPLTHIQREIGARQALSQQASVPVVDPSKKNSRVAPESATKSAVSKTAAVGANRGSASTRSASVSSSTTSASASTSSVSASTASSNKRGGRTSGAAGTVPDVSTNVDVQRLLSEEFAKYRPQLYHGDFKDIVDENIEEWKSKFTVLMLDPPFGILAEPHDVKIAPSHILRQCSRLLKPQGIITSKKKSGDGAITKKNIFSGDGAITKKNIFCGEGVLTKKLYTNAVNRK